MMKIEVVNCVLYRTNGQFGPGQILDIEDREAARLIALGVVKKAVIAPPPGADTTEPGAGTGADESAKKRAVAEETAIRLNIGTEEEIKALFDDELAARIKKAESEKRREALIAKAVEKGLGNAEEISALSNKEIGELFAK